MLVEDTDPEGFHFIQDSFWFKYGGLPHETHHRRNVINEPAITFIAVIQIYIFQIPQAYAVAAPGSVLPDQGGKVKNFVQTEQNNLGIPLT